MSTNTDTENTTIDETLFNRQLYVLGIDAMNKMAKSSVLVSGLGGVGVELAKNIILAGVKSVTLHDTENTTIKDLSSQFYLNESSIGKNRALESYLKLARLNEYVSVSTSTVELTNDFIKQFNCVVLTNPIKYSKIFEISQFCHENGICFILAMTRGVFGFIYNDFGDNFFIKDPSPLPPSRFTIESISNDEEGIVRISLDERHNLNTGDEVIFDHIKGMTELNGRKFTVKRINHVSFSIGDTSKFQPYDRSFTPGFGTKVIKPQTMQFKELKEALKSSNFCCKQVDARYPERGPLVIISFFSLFKSIEEGDTSVENILKNASIFNKEFGILDTEIDESFVREFVREDAVICPTAAVIGGIGGQEVIKSVSSKFVPLKMFLTLSYMEALQPIDDPSFSVTIKNDRYDSYRLVFGDKQFEVMTNLNYFMVGAGAIGCELLKNWAMMGVSINGKIYVTDMDKIERSNLNRQFLFSRTDIGKFKSKTAAEQVEIMNPDLKGHMDAQVKEIGASSELYYNSTFYNSLSGICNALDNVAARQYNSDQAVYYGKPLLESGTEGALGNFEAYIPHRTLTYDPNEYPTSPVIPECTVHYFPSNINHCTVWAKRTFETIFENEPTKVNQFISNKNYISEKSLTDKGGLYDNAIIIKKLIVDQKPKSYNDCIKLALIKFNELFNYAIKSLIKIYPKESKDENGFLFWSGNRRFPSAIDYDPSNELHAKFINATTRLYADMYKIKIPEDQSEDAAHIALNIDIPEFNPDENYGIDVSLINEGENQQQPEKKEELPDYDEKCRKICEVINKKHIRKNKNKLVIQTFDKDDNSKGHLDFVVAAANLRATNYEIGTETELKIKKIAGNIRPAIATTTAAVCGFVAFEMYKVHSITPKDLIEFKYGVINPAIHSYSFLPPKEVELKKIVIKDSNQNIKKEITFSIWDKWIIEGDLTVSEFIDEFEKKYDLNVVSLAVNNQKLNYNKYSPKINKRYEKRKITDIYQNDADQTLIPDRMIPMTLILYDDGNNAIEDKPKIMLKFF